MQVQMSVRPMLHAQVSVAATLTIQRPVYFVQVSNVVPTKSDSDVMFVNKVIWDLESIDHLCINPILQDRIKAQVI